MARTEYEVIVGNVGSVYDGTSKREAHKVYQEYIEISRSGRGRAGGEEVSLFFNDREIDCYVPVTDEDEDDDDFGGFDGGRMNNPSGGCEIYDAGIPDLYYLLYTDARGGHRRVDLQANGHSYDIGITAKQYASIQKRNRPLSLSALPSAARATAAKYMGKGRTANPRKKGSAVYDSTLSITSSPMFYTPNVFRGVMNDAQFKPVPKWCKSVLDAMNIPPAVAKELLSGKRGYKINDERETVEIPMTAAELDEAVAMSKRR
jgi:hypothetical protein